MKRIRNLLLATLLVLAGGGCRRSVSMPERQAVGFTDSLLLPVTGVKNQGETGTCWAFGGVSLIESGLLRDRAADSTVDLSEMWLVRQAYYEKAVKYVRTRGVSGFSQGGELHDALFLTQRYGVVPLSTTKAPVNY